MRIPSVVDLWARFRALRLALLALESYAVGRVPYDAALSRTIDLLTVEYEATMLVLADTTTPARPARPRRRRRRGVAMLTILPPHFDDVATTGEEWLYCLYAWTLAQLAPDAKLYPEILGRVQRYQSELSTHRVEWLRAQLREAAA